MSAPILLPGAGVGVINDVVVSVHRSALTHEVLDAFDRMRSRVPAPDYCTLGVYRFDRVRPSDFSDETVRKRIAEMGSSDHLRKGVAVLDGTGLANAAIRLALASVMMLLPRHRTFASASTVDEGIRLLTTATTTDPADIRRLVDTLVAEVWRAAA